MRAIRLWSLGVALIATSALASARQPAAPAYQLPPQVIVDILDAAPPPQVIASPGRDAIAVLDRASMPPIAELAQPMLRLAGLRIHPATNGLHRTAAGFYYRAVTIMSVATGHERAVTLPENAKLQWVGFSPDGVRFAFTHTRENGIELWVGETATGEAKSVTAAQLNGVFGTPCSWLADGGSLVCAFTLTSRGAPPAPPAVPSGPNVQESIGRVAPVRTYQDLLAGAYDEALFEYYATSQLAIVDASSGAARPLRTPYRHLAVARWGVRARHAREAALLVARAVPRLPEDGGGARSQGCLRPPDRGSASGRHGAQQRRAARATRLSVAPDGAGHAGVGRRA
jgi:hypothetical protein